MIYKYEIYLAIGLIVWRQCVVLQVATGDYFEMESMRHRAPLLYHQYIGQYNSDEFKQRSKATTLWESILENLDEADYKER